MPPVYLTFKLRGRQRQAAKPGLAKMYRVPPERAWWPADGAPLGEGLGLSAVELMSGLALQA